MIKEQAIQDAIRIQMNETLLNPYFNDSHKDSALYVLEGLAGRFDFDHLVIEISNARINLEGVA